MSQKPTDDEKDSLESSHTEKHKEKQKENQVRIVLPTEQYSLIEYESEALPCIAMLNTSLAHFTHQNVFCWHLSVIMDFDETEIIDNGMPSKKSVRSLTLSATN